MRIRLKIAHLLLVTWLVGANFSSKPAIAQANWRGKVDVWVWEQASAGETEFLIYLTEQADLSAAAGLRTKTEKGNYVYRKLSETAQRTQGRLIAALQAWGVVYQPFWVANMIWARGDLNLVQSLAQRGDVAHIYANPHVRLEEPGAGLQASEPHSGQAIEWNILKVNADKVWAAGYTGQTAVIGGQDTGYAWSHPALIRQYRGWNGVSADHNYNWHDAIHDGGGVCGANSSQPCDDNGHGTHTMGTMVGDDGGSNRIGMAPGARWIGCRNMDQGVGTPATYAECYQWFIAPTDMNNQNPRPDLAPDVINNSWSCPSWEGCTDPNVLLSVVNNVRAAGILSVHSAGNSGPECGTINTPAAIYDASFTVGATDSGDQIAIFSSRGPVNADGSNRLKPDISAPGVGVRSALPGGTYGLKNGTSMAAPHVAGLAALLISASPPLRGQVDELESLIEHTAIEPTTSQTCGGVPETEVPNNVYGWGRIDAWAALTTYSLWIHKAASAAQMEPGGLLTYTLTVTNTNFVSPTHNLVLSDTLPLHTSFVSSNAPYAFNGATITWQRNQLEAGASWQVDLVVAVENGTTGMISNSDYSAKSDEVATPVSGSPVVTPAGLIFYLPLVSKN